MFSEFVDDSGSVETLLLSASGGDSVERRSARWVSPRTSAIPHRRFSRLVGVEAREDESVFPGLRAGKRRLPDRRRILGWLLLVGLCAGGSLWTLGQPKGALDRGPGQVVADFEIRDVRTGQLDRLSQHRGRVVAIVFTGTSCPVGALYMPRLSDLSRFFELRDVDFLAINSNASDSIEDVAEHARRSRVTFPVLKDPENRVADRLLAERTCEALVIDGRGRLRYRGAIDDQYGLGTRRDSPGHTYLVDAIEAVLAGREVSPATTEVAGCPIERVIPVKARSGTTFSYFFQFPSFMGMEAYAAPWESRWKGSGPQLVVDVLTVLVGQRGVQGAAHPEQHSNMSRASSLSESSVRAMTSPPVPSWDEP